MEIPPVEQAVPRINKNGDDKKLREAVAGFESIFYQQMLAGMRRSIPEGKLFHGGQGEKMFRDMMDVEYAKNLSSVDNPHGLKEEMYHQLTRARMPHPVRTDTINPEG